MQPENQSEELEIDLKELLLEMLAHWKVIVLATIMVGAIAFVLSKFIIVPKYESTSELYVLSKNSSFDLV